ncbi:4Fe-4S dicluster domain-containing protein [Pseudomonas sp. PDM31]|nr:4Fe-4S dicluster domain-containing protein [Pseudomonas sp. PDM31]
MPKIVRMVVEVIEDLCTGCNLCSRVCPTAAFTLRDRLPSEAGTSRMIVELDHSACYNAQRCLEVCPHEALLMKELDEPFLVGADIHAADQAAIEALCAKTGIPSAAPVCPCTGTTMGELAAAILQGANTPEKLSLATGVRTGCSELCMHPVLVILAAAGHADAPKYPKGYQWYAAAPSLFQHVGADGKLPQALKDKYPEYRLDEEIADLGRLRALSAIQMPANDEAGESK